jgi:hypothetical protein
MLVAVGVLLLNLPFGFWREGVRKFSVAWFLAVHLPIPLMVTLRLVSGMGWRLSSFPFVLGAYCVGQFCGGALRRRLRPVA